MLLALCVALVWLRRWRCDILQRMSAPDHPSDAFFIADPAVPGRYVPSSHTVGPWSKQHQHGGPPIALITRALRKHPGEPDMRLARVTVEILGPVPLDTCDIEVQVIRPGRRIELLQAVYRVQGKPVLSAQAWRMQEVGNICPAFPDVWQPPALPEFETDARFEGMDPFPYGQALEWRFVSGGFAEKGPACVWGRLRMPLVLGTTTHGIEGLLTLLDSANGISGELDLRHWTFVPVDLTLNLTRDPIGPWYGMDARTVIHHGGTGLVTTTVFDSLGPVGKSLHTLFVRPR